MFVISRLQKLKKKNTILLHIHTPSKVVIEHPEAGYVFWWLKHKVQIKILLFYTTKWLTNTENYENLETLVASRFS